MIKYLVDIVSSKRDIYGNCYHAATITRVSDNLSLSGTVDAPSNVAHYLNKNGLACFGHNEVHETQTTLPIREFNRLTKQYKRIDGDSMTLFFKLNGEVKQ